MIDFYVNSSADGAGDGTTNAETGPNGAYQNWSDWEANEQRALTESVTAWCSRGTTPGAKDTSLLVINGWTGSNASIFITVRGHDASAPDQTNAGTGFNPTGIFDANAYFTSAAVGNVIQPLEAFTRIQQIQLESVNTGSNSRYLFANSGSAVDIVIGRCLFKRTAVVGTNNRAILLQNAARWTISNNVFWGFSDTNNTAIQSDLQDVKIYNNTLYDCERAIYLTAGFVNTILCKNNAIFNNLNDLVDLGSGTNVFDFNATDDPYPSGAGDPRGASGVPLLNNDGGEWDNAVTNRVIGDFTVKDAASLLHAAGVDNATDPDVPTEDYFGNVRATYDIGFADLVASGGGTVGVFQVPMQMGASFTGIAPNHGEFSVPMQMGAALEGWVGPSGAFSVPMQMGASLEGTQVVPGEFSVPMKMGASLTGSVNTKGAFVVRLQMGATFLGVVELGDHFVVPLQMGASFEGTVPLPPGPPEGISQGIRFTPTGRVYIGSDFDHVDQGAGFGIEATLKTD